MKVFLLFCSCLLLTAALAGCSARPATPAPTAQPTAKASPAPTAAANPIYTAPETSAAQDGTYTARMSEAYAREKVHGWQTTLTVTFAGGRPVETAFDAFQDGKKKSEQSPEVYPMVPHPSEWMPQLAEQVKNAAQPEDIEGVSGATIGSAEAKQLYAAILKAAQKGEPKEITVD